MQPLTVAAVQATPAPGDIAGNARLAARLVVRAAERGARLAVLPELFLPAYHMPSVPGATLDADAAGAVADARLDPLASTAWDLGAGVVVGAAVRDAAGVRRLSLLLVDPSGGVRSVYDKQHLWGPDERALFTPGDSGATIEVAQWRLGLGICYDGCFPEHARAAALADAHGHLYPSGFLAGSRHRRDLYYAARALDNTAYVVFANLVGPIGGHVFNGGSAVYDPQGRVLDRAADEGEAVVVATLDPAELAATRAAHTMLADRRSDLSHRRAIVTA